MDVRVDGRSATLIRQRVASGRFADAAAVVREALRLLDERDHGQALRAELQIGLDQIERGETVDFTPELLDELTIEAEQNAREGKPIRDAVKP